MIKIVPVNKNKTLIVKIHNEQIKQAKVIMLFLKISARFLYKKTRLNDAKCKNTCYYKIIKIKLN